MQVRSVFRAQKKQPPDVFYKKGVLRDFTKFKGKHLCQILIFNRVAGLSLQLSLREKCPYSELFWSECGKMWTRITPNIERITPNIEHFRPEGFW